MSSFDHAADIIFASLVGLDYRDGTQQRLRVIGTGIKHLSIYRILELRQRICARFGQENPSVQAALQIIDGQIVLREIADGAGWR